MFLNRNQGLASAGSGSVDRLSLVFLLLELFDILYSFYHFKCTHSLIHGKLVIVKALCRGHGVKLYRHNRPILIMLFFFNRAYGFLILVFNFPCRLANSINNCCKIIII